MKNVNDYSKMAELYDAYVRETFDVPFFLKEAKQSSGEVLELMSGTGRVSIPLLMESIPLTCLDNSPEMLSILKRKLIEKNLMTIIHQMDIRELSIDKHFELIIIPFHSFSELLDPDDQKKALTAIYNHLSESGHFICTLQNPFVRLKTVDGHLHLYRKYPLEHPKGMIMLWGLEEYDPQRTIVHVSQFVEVYDSDGFMQTKSHVDIHFFLYKKDHFEALLKSVGFQVLDIYGDYSYSKFDEKLSPFMIWMLKRQ